MLVAFIGVAFVSAMEKDIDLWKYRASKMKNYRAKLAGAERPSEFGMTVANDTKSLGYDETRDAPGQPGLKVGDTYYDLQSNCRINRQIEMGDDEWIHMVWMKSYNSDDQTLLRGTTYEIWDAGVGSFAFAGLFGGIDIHPFNGPGNNYSGYVSLDVHQKYGLASKACIANHHDEGAGYSSTVWFDFKDGYGFFSAYKYRIPDSLMKLVNSPEDTLLGDYEMIWPQHEYQTWDGDTCVHVFAQQFEDKDPEASVCAYFRYHGSDTTGKILGDAVWDVAMIVDTIPVLSQCVSASDVSAKVALVWEAPPGEYPGDPESHEREGIDPGLGVNQRINDIYYMISQNMGTTWGPKININAYDSTQGGWLGHGEISTLIDSYNVLHIVSSMRQIEPADAGLGEYVHFWGSRLRHWDEFNNQWTTVKDANWAVEEEWADTFCVGGAWNEISIVKPTISECQGKYYVIFTQFQDVFGGVYDDCHDVRFSDGDWDGTANGELYVSVSDNRGLNWDLARNLTNTHTPYCDTIGGSGPGGECGHEHYASMPRFGRQEDVGIFDGIPIIDPSSGGYSGNYYLPILYVADRFPGSCMQDRGVWTINPVKLFRMPCVDPVPSPILAYTPSEIGPPAWTKPGVPYVDTGYWENIGNVLLNITGVAVNNPGNTVVAGWSASYGPGTGSPITITVTTSTYGYFIDTIKISSNSVTGSPQYIPIEILIADTVQFPEEKDIRTMCKRIIFSNTGNLGSQAGLNGNGAYNLDFFYDIDLPRYECDTTDNESNEDDQAKVYLYDASPFLAYIQGGDTILTYSMYDANWLSDDGFRPLYSPYADSTTYPDYQYGYSNVFVNRDTTIAVEVEYFAPKDDPDTNCFIVMKQRIYTLEGASVPGVFVGDLMDWDVPSDTGSRNASDYDETRKLMWCQGAEYIADSIVNNDCVLADQRYGGFAYGIGLHISGTDSTFINNPKATWSNDNATYVYPENAFVADQIYELCVNKNGYSTFESLNPDSEFVDLHVISCFGQFDLTPIDTLIFCKILATTYEGEIALKDEVDKAKAWVANHGLCPKPSFVCDCLPGDATGNDIINILDITRLINYLYKGGPPPIPYGTCSGDPNANCIVNILDITYLINFLYKGGPPPKTCEEWVASCGTPIYK